MQSLEDDFAPGSRMTEDDLPELERLIRSESGSRQIALDLNAIQRRDHDR
jgi:hypothetical protein